MKGVQGHTMDQRISPPRACRSDWFLLCLDINQSEVEYSSIVYSGQKRTDKPTPLCHSLINILLSIPFPHPEGNRELRQMAGHQGPRLESHTRSPSATFLGASGRVHIPRRVRGRRVGGRWGQEHRCPTVDVGDEKGDAEENGEKG